MAPEAPPHARPVPPLGGGGGTPSREALTASLCATLCNRKSSEPLRMWAAYRLAESGGGHVLARTLRSLGGNGKACRPQLPPPPPARTNPRTTHPNPNMTTAI